MERYELGREIRTALGNRVYPLIDTKYGKTVVATIGTQSDYLVSEIVTALNERAARAVAS